MEDHAFTQKLRGEKLMEATSGYHPSESEAGTWLLEVQLFKEPSTSPNLASERPPSQSRSDLRDVVSPGPTGKSPSGD